jgi:hypothetical protein
MQNIEKSSTTTTTKTRKRKGPPVKRACENCRRSHVSCSESRPCERCVKKGLTCGESNNSNTTKKQKTTSTTTTTIQQEQSSPMVFDMNAFDLLNEETLELFADGLIDETVHNTNNNKDINTIDSKLNELTQQVKELKELVQKQSSMNNNNLIVNAPYQSLMNIFDNLSHGIAIWDNNSHALLYSNKEFQRIFCNGLFPTRGSIFQYCVPTQLHLFSLLIQALLKKRKDGSPATKKFVTNASLLNENGEGVPVSCVMHFEDSYYWTEHWQVLFLDDEYSLDDEIVHPMTRRIEEKSLQEVTSKLLAMVDKIEGHTKKNIEE